MLLNLEPDHLDRHGSFEAYRDGEAADLRAGATPKIVPRGFGLDGHRVLAPTTRCPAEPLIRGAHNRENAAAATAARARPAHPRTRSPRRSRTLPRRAAPPRARRASSNGVRYVNDSKATNVAAARRALAAYADAPRAPDPRRLPQGRGLRAARRRAAAERARAST